MKLTEKYNLTINAEELEKELVQIKEKAKADWVDSFSVAGSMLIAMTAAIFLGRLV